MKRASFFEAAGAVAKIGLSETTICNFSLPKSVKRSVVYNIPFPSFIDNLKTLIFSKFLLEFCRHWQLTQLTNIRLSKLINERIEQLLTFSSSFFKSLNGKPFFYQSYFRLLSLIAASIISSHTFMPKLCHGREGGIRRGRYAR